MVWMETTCDILNDLKLCTSLHWGKLLHAQAVELQKNADMYIMNAVVNMYCKSGSMTDARCLFDNIHEPDIVSWNTLLLGYTESGEAQVTLELFSLMEDRIAHNSFTFVAALKACTSIALSGTRDGKERCLELGREIHMKVGCHLNQYVQNTLIDMYAKSGSISEARQIFDSIEKPNTVSWNAMLLGHAENGEGHAALDLFSRMKACGIAPNSVTYIGALKGCTSNGDGGRALERVREIHSEIGPHMNVFLHGMLIDTYAKCGSMVEARSVFDNLRKPDLVCLNSLLLGYVENGDFKAALDLYSKAKASTFPLDSVTYIGAVKACTALALHLDGCAKKDCLNRGREIHSQIDCHLSLRLQNTLLDMYCKCGSMVEAHNIFDNIHEPDVVSWSALVLGYAENGKPGISLDLFSKAKEAGLTPNPATYIAALKACACLVSSIGKERCLDIGRDIHSDIGCDFSDHLQNTLIDVYSKCGSMPEARRVFDNLRNRDVVSWNILLVGYVESGEGHIVIDLFSNMKEKGCAPNCFTYIAVLRACGFLGALALGRKFHLEIKEFNPEVVTCLVDFYSNCGSMVEAREVFDLHLKLRDVTTWTALLSGYSRFGDSGFVFQLFEKMQDESLHPDAVTFVCLLLCCSHAGLVERAKHYFKIMHAKFGVVPAVIHYTCMVDVHGRGNRLPEAIGIIRKMPCNPDSVIWMTLLGACRKWRNLEIGREAFQAIIDMDNKIASSYVLMAHIYGTNGMHEEQSSVFKNKTKLIRSCDRTVAPSANRALLYIRVVNT